MFACENRNRDAVAQQGTIRIDDVRVGRRHRRDLGDVDGLTERRRPEPLLSGAAS